MPAITCSFSQFCLMGFDIISCCNEYIFVCLRVAYVIGVLDLLQIHSAEAEFIWKQSQQRAADDRACNATVTQESRYSL